FGLTGEPLQFLALCASVPTAMTGYLLARQMGGDAPLYAAVTTVQTVASFLTIPAVMWAAGLVAGGQLAGG
ncbi:MAG: AEC family transporter, partial [Hoeflea sp.]|nr:AEC family transporter [Hoeflea sp.]